MGLEVGGIVIGLIVLIAEIWVIIHILQSTASLLAKGLWILLILALPLLGLIIWLLAGPRARV